MYTEKVDINALIDYARHKHKPDKILISEEEGADQHDATHLIYEIGGDSKTRVLTRVGEAKPGSKIGDFTLHIYPHYAVSGELVLIKKSAS